MHVQQRLFQEGISEFRHITSIEGDILQWPQRAVDDLAPGWQRACTKLVSNPLPIALPLHQSPKKQLVYVTSLPLQEGSTIWQLEMTRAQQVQRWLPGELTISARHAFRYNRGRNRGLLANIFHSEPPQNVVLTQLVTAPNRGHDANRLPTEVLGSVFDPIGQTVLYTWRNGAEIFTADTRQLRLLQSPAAEPLHIGPHKWTVEFSWTPRPSLLWNPLWKSYRAEIENCFLWQIMYRIPATDQWRFPLAGETQPETWCTRCQGRALEDVTHCFWACPKSMEIWDWIRMLVQRAVQSQTSYVTLTAPHVLLGRNLPAHYKISNRWWSTIRAAALWQIWKLRCARCMDHKPSSALILRSKIWHRLQVYLRETWQSYRLELDSGQISVQTAKNHMTARFGDDALVFTFTGRKLILPVSPPRAP